jgi:uncharacterized membrane protein YhaH (DUF805 family)
MEGALETLRRWREYGGRARRTEYWMFVLWSYIAIVILFIGYAGLTAAMGAPEGGAVHILFFVLFFLFWVSITAAQLAVSVRRLHDAGFSGWWLLMLALPPLSIVLLIFFCLDSQPGENRFGPNPKFAS